MPLQLPPGTTGQRRRVCDVHKNRIPSGTTWCFSRGDLLNAKVLTKQNLSSQSTNNFTPASKASALAQIRILIPQVDRLLMAATSGKDCRAPQMAAQ